MHGMKSRINDQYIGPQHSFLAVVSILRLFCGLNEIAHRLLIEVEGTIMSSQTTSGNRPATTYIIRGPDGNESQYIAGPTDRSLLRRLSEGTYIKKKKYELTWQKNGKNINDFPFYFYLVVCGIGPVHAYWAFSQWRLNRSKRTNA